MSIIRKACMTLVCSITILFSITLTAQEVRVSSPDGRIVFTLDNGDAVRYKVDFNGRSVIGLSDMGFTFNRERAMGDSLEMAPYTVRDKQETWIPVVRNKHSHVSMKWRETVVQLRETTRSRRRMDIEIRAFDEGVAFRYHLYGNDRLRTREITSEETRFAVPEGSQAYVCEYPTRYRSSQEAEFFKKPLEEILPETLAGLPLLIEVDEDCFMAITEAFIDDYPGFYVSGGDALKTMLAPLPGEPEDGIKARFEDEIYTPWRVVMIADNPGRFIESELIRTLNPPCTMAETSWIKPGMCAWDHWWSGEIKMEMDTIKEYIDLAAAEGWPYMLIDWTWYGPYNTPRADITKPAPQLDMPQILAYAKSKDVKIWLWLYSSDVNRNDAYKEAFALYEQWGVVGVKIDFMDRHDQDMTNWYRRVVSEAAKRHLMVDFHGAYKNDGMERTYPNFLTREGVMGNEYNKWDNGITPEHNVKLAFTRMLAGPMDYTPGGFLNVRPEDYKAQTPTLIPNTRCAELSKFVIYESPYTVVCDHPRNILGQPGADFLKIVPTVWDDIRFLQGGPDDYIAMAKRNGREWYIGAMNNSVAREITLDTSFLDDGDYVMEYWADGAEPTDVKHESIALPQTIRINMASGGGYVAVIRPVTSSEEQSVSSSTSTGAIFENAFVPDATVYIPAPPEMASELMEGDLAYYEWGKAMRGTPRGRQAFEDADSSMDHICEIFSEAMGVELSEENSPMIYALLDMTDNTTYLKGNSPKNHFKRVRPYIFFEEPSLVPDDEKWPPLVSYSYPSGHTVEGWTVALLLCEINPAAATELLRVGYEYGQSRVIAGYHWQSDVDAGRTMAAAQFATLQADKDFQKALKKARKEFTKLSR